MWAHWHLSSILQLQDALLSCKLILYHLASRALKAATVNCANTQSQLHSRS